ncbi:hypothetical protein [Archaeoglobus veneficus]|uniref:Uncharacterized protein n=1 Tax=Archaeoglobus veneficus (strain DSM 11195 / SNP6) TaxID=693661 RepID=F2KRF2_ARCVS|nr:hypothetical protein [Archaeoglobus veneficus]AEA47886.1 hypothetical protein Arcve_1893 [Archaeoglobus veneficus SNP6]
MGDNAVTLIGVVIGFLFGMSGIATLFSIMNAAISEAAMQLSQINAASTLVLLIAAIILIIKIRVISALIVGAIIGAVLNLILELNGIHLTNEIYSVILNALS